MRQSLRTRLTAYVFVKLKTFARCGCALLCVASVFLHAVDLEGLSLPTAETLHAATDKLIRVALPRGHTILLQHGSALAGVASPARSRPYFS